MAQPIPINARSRAGRMAGSAFVATDGTSFWLTTCVHVITHEIDNPPNAIMFRDATVTVLGSNLEIGLYDQFGEQRFIAVKNELDGYLLDVLTIKLDNIEAAKLTLFGVYDLREAVLPTVGQEAMIHGFPGLESTPVPPTSMTTIVAEVFGSSVKLDKPSTIGFSGGPITIGGNIVGVIHGDVGAPNNLKNGLGIIFHDLLKQKLFRKTGQ